MTKRYSLTYELESVLRGLLSQRSTITGCVVMMHCSYAALAIHSRVLLKILKAFQPPVVEVIVQWLVI
jgi:hypothetical protein